MKRLWQTPQFHRTIKMSAGGLGVGSAGLYAVVTNPAQIGAKPEGADEKKHHLKNGKGFVNPWDSYRELSPFRMLTAMLWYVTSFSTFNRGLNCYGDAMIETQLILFLYGGMYVADNSHRRKISGQANSPDTTAPTVPIITPTFLPSRDTPKLRATWLGHACYYVEFPGGFRVLFDPVFEDCCAPIKIKSLKRYTEPPCQIEDLPIVDAVVISHNHYDHLSYPTIKRIQKKFPNAHFFAPLGNKKWFLDSGVTNVTELDWWESRDVKLEIPFNDKDRKGSIAESTDVSVAPSGEHQQSEKGIVATIGALPCQHVSARTPFDKCRTLWASWMVESGGKKVYFAG